MKHYLQSQSEVLSALRSSENGLTSSEAEARLAEHGKNRLAEGKKDGIVKKFLLQLADPMIIILIVAAVISAVIAVIEKETPTDVFIIMFVVILNAVLGVIQESKAEKAIEALKEMTAATSKVLRDGKVINVKSEDLVPGDVIVLEAGDAVPADARIIESNSLKCEEAALTGESVPSEKHETVLSAGENGDVPLGDRANMIYMGSTVVYGRGKAVITATGMDTEMGKIATALANVAEEKTPASDEAGTAFKNTYMARFGNMCVHIRIQRYKERRLWYRIASQYVYNSCKPCRRRNTGRSCRSCNDSAFHGCYENVKARRCNTPSYSR